MGKCSSTRGSAVGGRVAVDSVRSVVEQRSKIAYRPVDRDCWLAVLWWLVM